MKKNFGFRSLLVATALSATLHVHGMGAPFLGDNLPTDPSSAHVSISIVPEYGASKDTDHMDSFNKNLRSFVKSMGEVSEETMTVHNYGLVEFMTRAWLNLVPSEKIDLYACELETPTLTQSRRDFIKLMIESNRLKGMIRGGFEIFYNDYDMLGRGDWIERLNQDQRTDIAPCVTYFKLCTRHTDFASETSKILHELPNIIELDLSGHALLQPLVVEDLSQLLSSVSTKKRLARLNLRYNKMTDKEAEFLAQALDANETISSLMLGGNKIGDKGKNAVEQLLKKNKNLTITYYD